MRHLLFLLLSLCFAVPAKASETTPICRFITMTGATAIDYAPDGSTIAVGYGTGETKVYDAGMGRHLVNLNAYVGAVTSLRFTPDSKCLMIGGSIGVVVCRDIKTGRLVETICTPSNEVRHIVFSPNGKLLAIGSGQNHLETYERGERWVPKREIVTGDREVTSVFFTANNRLIGVAGTEGTVNFMDVRTGETTGQIVIGGTIGAISANFANTEMVICGRFMAPVKYSVYGHRLVPISDQIFSQVAMYSPNLSDIAFGLRGRVQIWNRYREEVTATFSYHVPYGTIECIRYSPDGERLLTLSQRGAVYLWDKSFIVPP